MKSIFYVKIQYMLTETDYLLGERLQIKQNAVGYRAGLDAVLLAAAVQPFAPISNQKHPKIGIVSRETDLTQVLDVGCGVGTASLCLQARLPQLRITGIDIQSEMIALAQENAILNQFDIQFIANDIMQKQSTLPGNQFDQVMTNPPYLSKSESSQPQDATRATAFLTDIPLKDWLGFCRRQLKQGGWLTVIYRADRLPELIAALTGFGNITFIPIWPKPGVPAKRVIIRAQKDRKSPAIMHPGLLLYDADGQPTVAATEILRNAGALI